MKRSKLLTIILSVVTALFILSVSIAVPILFRPFYYMQIESLKLEEQTGLAREQIVTAYDEMLNFCIGITEEFSTGVLEWSESGRAHFVDVKGLFLLDLRIALLTGVILILCKGLKKRVNVRQYRFCGKGSGFWGSIGLGVTFLIVGVLGTIDFDKAFEIFHKIFFRGKDNWIFDYETDQIIAILPKAFFRNCTILVLVFIFLLCVGFIITDFRKSLIKNVE